MFMRLAFSIATHVDPEILIIDEILAVGDEHFGRKSRAKMDEFRGNGKTIFLVTHDLGTIERWCDRAAWLEGGVIRAEGSPTEVIRHYKSSVAEFEIKLEQNGAKPIPPPVELAQPQTAPAAMTGIRWGSFDQEIASVRVLGESGEPQVSYRADQPLTLEVELLGKKTGLSPLYTAVIIRSDGMALWETRISAAELSLSMEPGQRATLRLALPRVGLADGDYRFDLSITHAGEILDFHKALYPFQVSSGGEPVLGLVRLEHGWSAAGAPENLLIRHPVSLLAR
jgi:lipopolysaccharide transport system ATP-binding protein